MNEKSGIILSIVGICLGLCLLFLILNHIEYINSPEGCNADCERQGYEYCYSEGNTYEETKGGIHQKCWCMVDKTVSKECVRIR